MPSETQFLLVFSWVVIFYLIQSILYFLDMLNNNYKLDEQEVHEVYIYLYIYM